MNKRGRLRTYILNRFFPLDLERYQQDLLHAIEDMQDSFLRQEKGTAARVATQWAGKFGVATASSGALLGIASLFGTASTGTAIGTLSGAAYTSSALAWLGGSVAMGSAIVGGVGLASGIGAYFGIKWLWRRYLSGTPRTEDELKEFERLLYCSLKAIQLNLRTTQLDQNQSFSYYVIWTRALSPALKELSSLRRTEYSTWPALARWRYDKALKRLIKLRRKAQGRLAQRASIPIGTITAVAMLLLEGKTEFEGDELLVLEAFRRSTPELHNASPEQITEYIAQYQGKSLEGLLNNIKGIYHELAYIEHENNDGDQWFADIAVDVSQPGFDFSLRNAATDETFLIQLKTNASSIYEHRSTYDYAVMAPTDVADDFPGVMDSGFTKEELNNSLDRTVDKLDDSVLDSGTQILETSLTAATITMAISIGSALAKGESYENIFSDTAKRGATSLKVAGAMTFIAEAIT